MRSWFIFQQVVTLEVEQFMFLLSCKVFVLKSEHEIPIYGEDTEYIQHYRQTRLHITEVYLNLTVTLTTSHTLHKLPYKNKYRFFSPLKPPTLKQH